MSEENIENITKTGSYFFDHHVFPDIYFNGHCLINSNIFIPKKVENLYILNKFKKFKHRFYIKGFLGSVKLTKNAGPDKYKHSGYEIGFDSCSECSFTDGRMGKNVIIFGGDMN